MRRKLLVALAALLVAGPAAAQQAGNYAVQGVGPDGSSYSGNLLMEPVGKGAWRMTWRIAGDTLVGVGIAAPNLLAAGYSDNGRAGAVLYDVAPNGVLSGRWVAPDGGLGTETLTPR